MQQESQWPCLGHANVLKVILSHGKQGGSINIITHEGSTNIVRASPIFLWPTWKLPHNSTDFLVPIIFLCPDRVIKILCGGGILAQSQGGDLYHHECAAGIERDRILIGLEENPNIIVFLLKQDPLLYEIIVGNKKVPVWFF